MERLPCRNIPSLMGSYPHKWTLREPFCLRRGSRELGSVPAVLPFSPVKLLVGGVSGFYTGCVGTASAVGSEPVYFKPDCHANLFCTINTAVSIWWSLEMFCTTGLMRVIIPVHTSAMWNAARRRRGVAASIWVVVACQLPSLVWFFINNFGLKLLHKLERSF